MTIGRGCGGTTGYCWPGCWPQSRPAASSRSCRCHPVFFMACFSTNHVRYTPLPLGPGLPGPREARNLFCEDLVWEIADSECWQAASRLRAHHPCRRRHLTAPHRPRLGAETCPRLHQDVLLPHTDARFPAGLAEVARPFVASTSEGTRLRTSTRAVRSWCERCWRRRCSSLAGGSWSWTLWR